MDGNWLAELQIAVDKLRPLFYSDRPQSSENEGNDPRVALEAIPSSAIHLAGAGNTVMDGNRATGLQKAVDELLPKVLEYREEVDGNSEVAAELFQAIEEIFRNHLSPRHIDRTNLPRRLRVLEGLLRNRLKFVKYSITQPAARVGTVGIQRSLLVHCLAATLEGGADVIAAILLRAALNAAENSAGGEDTAIMDEFLHLAIGFLLDDPRKGGAFIYTVLEDLMQREAEGDGGLESAQTS
ncbi:hypothetical protein B0T18DRAFT_408492 [Schizothecium vesticola]|uniref:Uncharacterized protein n=1 Tax=Schizothecium vesticola TaxID=314040 RepID=A0AA40F2X7_9PEZI|nr:hypothetical protein B0T18DRAFT_408492 [Schizothecium vesticola]